MVEFLLGYWIGKDSSVTTNTSSLKYRGTFLGLIIALVLFVATMYFSSDVVHLIRLDSLAPSVDENSPTRAFQIFVKNAVLLGMNVGIAFTMWAISIIGISIVADRLNIDL